VEKNLEMEKAGAAADLLAPESLSALAAELAHTLRAILHCRCDASR
jgi:hypothetical protein